MNDIENRGDIQVVLNAFYRKAFEDELIGLFFTEVVLLNLDSHLPVITDFWEFILFGNHHYRKNVMEIHRNINHLSSIRKNI